MYSNFVASGVPRKPGALGKKVLEASSTTAKKQYFNIRKQILLT